MAEESRGKETWVFVSKNFIDGLASPTDFITEEESEHARVITLSFLDRMRRSERKEAYSLSLKEFERYTKRAISEINRFVMYVSMEPPRFPLSYSEILKLLRPEQVTLVLSPAISRNNGKLKVEVLAAAGFAPSRAIDASPDDESGTMTMGRLRKQVLRTGRIAGTTTGGKSEQFY
ncbi:MAG: hypothetical protein JWN50_114 [Parcubacteria group bacterium]|nr:hypothetical protein [Parcubacteria group bacterium]